MTRVSWSMCCGPYVMTRTGDPCLFVPVSRSMCVMDVCVNRLLCPVCEVLM